MTEGVGGSAGLTHRLDEVLPRCGGSAATPRDVDGGESDYGWMDAV